MADHKGKPPHNLLCDAQKGTNPAYRDGYDRIFGVKPLPHGKPDCRDCDGDQCRYYDIDEGNLMEKLIDELEGLGKDLEDLAGYPREDECQKEA